MYEILKHGSGVAASNFPKTRSNLLLEKFRGWSLGIPACVSIPDTDIPTIITVGGGKGGVGKSLISANIAVKLAMSKFRVLVVDMDLGCANLHTHFGIGQPKDTLVDFILKKSKTFSEVLVPTTVPSIALVAGGQDTSWGRVLADGTEVLTPLWDEILRAKQTFQVDFVVLDLGAGAMQHTVEFFSAAHLGVMTVLPEPSSIENAYMFLKTYLWNLVDTVSCRVNMVDEGKDIKSALTQVTEGAFAGGYIDCFRRLSASHPQLIGEILQAMQGRFLGLVVNQARYQRDIEMSTSMEHICRKYFGLNAFSLGYLNYDEAAWKSMRNRKLLLADFAQSALARCFSKMTFDALRLLGY